MSTGLLRLHLVVDADLGPALWVRQQTAPGRSRALEELGPLRDAAPPAVRQVLASAGERLRHRVRIPGRDGDRRVPALPLDGAQLVALATAVRERMIERFGEGMHAQLAELIASGTAALLSEGVAAMPDLLAAAVLDERAAHLVTVRHLDLDLVDRPDGTHLVWRAPTDGPAVLHSLVDARARAAVPPCPVSSEGLSAPNGAPVPDAAVKSSPPPSPAAAGLPAALGPAQEPLGGTLPQRRALLRGLRDWLRGARSGVKLSSTQSELVVRLFEPPVGTAWPLQTCLREADGTVHAVADLRAVGDVTPSGAAEASAAVLRLAPTIRGAAVDDTGVDWLLTTAEAGAFLAHDAPALEDAGVTVLLPRDWTRQRTTLRPEVQEEDAAGQDRRAPGVGLGAMASFRWRVAVGETELTDEEMAEIREAQGELVRLRGQWVRLDAATLRAAERFLDSFAATARAARREQSLALDPLRPGELRDDGSGSDGTGRDRTGRAAPDGTGHAASPGRRSEPDLVPVPASVTGGIAVEGSMSWADLFSLLLSPDMADLDLARDVLARSRGVGLLALLPGGTGPEQLPQPASLRATLRPYQLGGLNWMWTLHRLGLGGILADDMGLGKTMQVLSLLCRERETVPGTPSTGSTDPSATGGAPHAAPGGTPPSAGEAPSGPASEPSTRTAAPSVPSPGPTLLVCPMSVVGAWQREARTFAPHLTVHVHHGADRIREDAFVAGAADTDLVITTYALLARDRATLQGVDWHRIVFDEAQHLKNPGTQVTKAARALPAAHRLALTGTPVENRLGDLHSLMEAVNPGLLGTASSFRERIATPVETEGDAAALSRLKFVTSPFILRRVKTDRSIIADLPEKTELTRVVNLTAEQAGLYQALVDELMVEIDGADEKQRRTLVVSTLTKLKQVCNHPAHFLQDGSATLRDGEHRSGKLDLVDDLLTGAFASGAKVLAFTQFTSFGRLLVPYWSERFGIDVPFLHGGVTKADRDAMVADFQARPDEPGLMLLSLRAGGTGLTLTAASHVVHLDRWWNPAVENQATDRAFRIGQRRDVTVHKLVCAGTVEEKIDAVLRGKQDLADLTIAPGEDWLADLDDQALLSLLSLDEEER